MSDWNPQTMPVISRPQRAAKVEFIQAIRDELRARNAFRDEGTPENLTAWADARNTLEERKTAL